jgi:copper chaperone CopZ
VKSVFKSEEIACGGCTATIEKELSQLPGVVSVNGDSATKLVTVEHDDSLPVEGILAKLDEIGFESTVAR